MLRDAAIFIQARLGSTRLPGKAFMEVHDGWSVLQCVVDAAMCTDYPVEVLSPVADHWSFREHLTKVEELRTPPPSMRAARDFWPRLRIISGDADDVLRRYVIAGAPLYRFVCRITGDCPLISPWTIQRAIAIAVAGNLPYLDWSNAPDGDDVEVIRYDVLWEAHLNATDPADREHVTPWIRRKYPSMRPAPTPGIKYSVDTQEDLDRVRRIAGSLGLKREPEDIIAYLRENP